MKFTNPDAPSYQVEKANYLDPPKVSRSNGVPGAPRCSLDFNLMLDDHGLVVDDQTLRLEQFQGHETLSQAFEYQLQLRANDFFSSGLSQPWGSLSGANYGNLLNKGEQNSFQLDFDSVVGANATIILGTPETDNDIYQQPYPTKRPCVYFNGIISNFAMAERGVYHATMKPALFKLSLQNNYRLYSDLTILQVVRQILDDNNITYNKEALEKSPNEIVMGLANYRKQDWLQAGESDLDFINRLMHKVNLFYYFVHDAQSHCMVITDQPHYQTIYARQINANNNNVETDQVKPLYISYTEQDGMDRDDYIKQFKYQQNLTTSGITTVLAQKQATWEAQTTAATSPVFINHENSKEKLNFEQLHMVQYGASETEIAKMTDSAVNRLVAGKFEFSGSSNTPDLKAGHKFLVKETCADDPSDIEKSIQPKPKFSSLLPIRPELNNRQFVLTSVQHQATASGDYSNQFSAVDANGLPSPFDPSSTQQGSILALVVDKPSNTEGKTDPNVQGMVTYKHKGSAAKYLEKDSFSYDNKQFKYNTGGAADTYSCRGVYVQFIDESKSAIPHWVKLAEHMQTVPETGSYIVVSRSSDENEIPEVQQSLQAKGSKVIMPENYTTNTNVGNSYNTNYGDSTRVSFGGNVFADLATAKTIVESKRHSNQYNDVSYSQSSSYGYNISAKSHHVSMTGEGAKPEASHADMLDFVSFGYSVTYGDSKNTNITQGDNQSVSQQTGNTHNRSSQTGRSVSLSVQGGGPSDIIDGAGEGYISYSTNKTIGMTYQKSQSIGKSKSYSNNAGGTHNESTVVGGSYSWSKVDTSNSINIIGATTNESVTGASHSVSVTGITSNESVTGSSTSLSAIANNNSASAILNTNSASATLNSNDASITANANSVSSVLSGVSSQTDLRPVANTKQSEININIGVVVIM
jgi:uncharacterized protein involved in type VI secretion and phage assembly